MPSFAAMRSLMLTPRILWGAMNVTPIFYLVVLFIVPAPDAPETPEVAIALTAVSIALAAAGLYIPRKRLDDAIRNRDFPQRTEVKQEEALFRELAPTHQVFEESFVQVFRKIAADFLSSFVLSLALGEAIVLNGLVLGFLGFPPPVIAPFFALGWLLMLVRFPRPSAIRKRIERLKGATFAEH